MQFQFAYDPLTLEPVFVTFGVRLDVCNSWYLSFFVERILTMSNFSISLKKIALHSLKGVLSNLSNQIFTHTDKMKKQRLKCVSFVKLTLLLSPPKRSLK